MADIDFKNIFGTLNSIAPPAHEAVMGRCDAVFQLGDDFHLSPEQLLCVLAVTAGRVATSNCDVADEDTINERLLFFY